MNELETRTEQNTVQPACSIAEDGTEVILKVEMPGVDRNGISIELEKNELVITGKAATESASTADAKYLLRERRPGGYRKTFVIDESIDRDSVQASMSDGILTVTLSTRESAKPRKIAIA